MITVDLVIPDVHHKWGIAEKIIKRVESHFSLGKIYFLGDYFDDWHDGPYQSKKTAEWLVESTADPRRVHLMGNHDLPYMCTAALNRVRPTDTSAFLEKYLRATMCSGFDLEKLRAISHVDGIEQAFEKLHVAVMLDSGLVLSHAGMTTRNGVVGVDCGFLDELEPGDEEHALVVARYLGTAGFSRGGNSAVPGPLWLDFHADRHFYSSEFNQLVGHTQGKTVRSFKHKNGAQAVCLDTRMNHYGLLCDNGSRLVTYQTESHAEEQQFVFKEIQ